MMAVCCVSGALLLVLLTGASYSYPVKQGFDPSSSSYAAGASAGYNWEVPSSGGLAPAVSGAVSYPAGPQTAPRREPSYPQPSVQREPAAASSSSNSFPAPVNSGYASSSSAGPSSFQPASTQDITWIVAPPGPFSGEETSTRPSTQRFASSKPAPEPLGPSNVSPPGPFLPEFQAGELTHLEKSYEHGNFESETEEQGFQPLPSVQAVSGQDSTSQAQSSGLGRSWVQYPYDYMFLTGQYPPGTVSHFSSSFEQGRDNWQDTHYIRDYFPAYPSTPQVETVPADFAPAPQSVKLPSQPVQQSIGSSSYGQSGAPTGQNQPYGGVGLPGYLQPSRLERQGSPAGGYGTRKV